jgi:hypothetical protein
MDIPLEESGKSGADVPNPPGQSGGVVEKSQLSNQLFSGEESMLEYLEVPRIYSEIRALLRVWNALQYQRCHKRSSRPAHGSQPEDILCPSTGWQSCGIR